MTARTGGTGDGMASSPVLAGQPNPGRADRRVLLVCDWFLRYVAPFAEALSRTGAGVGLLCRDHASEFGGNHEERLALIERLRAAGVTVIVMPGSTTSVSRAAWGALAAVRRFDADVAHAQSEILDPRLLLAVHGLPLALMLHDPERRPGDAMHTRRHSVLQHLWRRRADLVLVHGERLARAVRSTSAVRAQQPVRVLPHGMTPREVPMGAPAEPAILLFGRLEYYKGVRVLLEAMHTVWEKRPEVRLIVAGQGPQAGEVPEDPRIEFRSGYIPEAEVDALFARASVAVLPYLAASQSGVGLLALGRGVPIVVTHVGDLPDLVPDDTFVARPGDAASLAERLLAHLDHDTAFRGELLAHARERFGWDAVARGALRIYDELLAARSPGRRRR